MPDSADHGEVPLPRHLPPRAWALLLKRVLDIDLEHCPPCDGPLTIIAAIEDPPVIAKILTHLGWSAPSSGQGLRSIPTGLIPDRTPLPSGSSP